MADRIFLTKDDKITCDENNLVNITCQNGTVFEHVEPRRLFPINNLHEYITMLDTDGKEVAIVRRMSDLDKDSRAVVLASLEDYYLVPTITHILSVSEKYGTIHWTVETDRGIKEFDIRNRNHDIKIYRDGRIRVRDADDNRYVIDDYNALDARSKKNLSSDI